MTDPQKSWQVCFRDFELGPNSLLHSTKTGDQRCANPFIPTMKSSRSGKPSGQNLAGTSRATDIHKELGGKGKFSRIRDLWSAHEEARDEEQETDLPLPEECQDRISEAVVSLQRSMEALVRGVVVRMTEQSVRQSAIRDRDFALIEAEHSKQVQSLEAEVAYLTECLDELEFQAEGECEATVTESADLAPERAASQEPAPAAEPLLAARKSPNRPLKKTPPSPRKAARQSPATPKKSPGQAGTRS